jgi:hypothetical protein
MARDRVAPSSPVPPAPSPEREALASAIEVRDARRQTLAAMETAVSAATVEWRRARDARADAASAVERAKVEAADFLTAVAQGDAPAAPLTIRAARTALVDAEDEEGAARAALDTLTSRAANSPLRDPWIPEEHVRKAVAAVLMTAPGVAPLLAEVERLQLELADKGAALLFLANNHALDLAGIDLGTRTEPSPARIVVDRLQSPMATWTGLTSLGTSVAPWRAALDALNNDAMADLPA